MFHIHRWHHLGRFSEAKYCRCGKLRYNPEEFHKSKLIAVLSNNEYPVFTEEELALLRRLAEKQPV